MTPECNCGQTEGQFPEHHIECAVVRHAFKCADALAGVRNPGAVAGVIEAARVLVLSKEDRKGSLDDRAQSYAASWHALRSALAALDSAPEEEK